MLAIEDSGFYDHGALNWSSLLRAVVENARAGEVVQGGSTITQQLVKNTLGLDPYDQSFERKFQELALAIRVEEKYTKDEIFELYLNQIYLGNGVYGIGTAAEFYFHKPASKLTLTEGAMLAGHDPRARRTTTRSPTPPRRRSAATTCSTGWRRWDRIAVRHLGRTLTERAQAPAAGAAEGRRRSASPSATSRSSCGT